MKRSIAIASLLFSALSYCAAIANNSDSTDSGEYLYGGFCPAGPCLRVISFTCNPKVTGSEFGQLKTTFVELDTESPDVAFATTYKGKTVSSQGDDMTHPGRLDLKTGIFYFGQFEGQTSVKFDSSNSVFCTSYDGMFIANVPVMVGCENKDHRFSNYMVDTSDIKSESGKAVPASCTVKQKSGASRWDLYKISHMGN